MKLHEDGEDPDFADTVIGAPPDRAPDDAGPDGAGADDAGPDEDTLVPGSPSMPFPLVEPAERALTADSERINPIVALEWEPDTQPSGPRVYAIRIATHAPISLNIPAMIGRRPSAPRISNGEHANLIRVPSPTREISSTHLLIRQEGTAVVVTDLDSTNGTIVTMPGFPPRKLRQGESAVVVPGTVIELGDGMAIEVLPLSEATS